MPGLNHLKCCCGPKCYVPKRCSDNGDAAFGGVPVGLVPALAVTFYFIIEGESETYYIPASATPVDCPETTVTNILQVAGCPSEIHCCQVLAHQRPCCVSTGSVANLALSHEAVDAPTGMYVGALAAWVAMAADPLPCMLLYDETLLTCVSRTPCPDNFFATYAKISPTWDYDDGSGSAPHRLFVFIRPLGGDYIGFAAAIVQKLTAGGWEDVGTLWTYIVNTGTPTCCYATATGNWYDLTTIDEIEMAVSENKCCRQLATAWDSGTTYTTGQIVSYDRRNWTAAADFGFGANLNRQPDISPLFWSESEVPCEETDADNCPADEECDELDAP